MLSNASISLTHWLQPPAFGFESLMRTRHPAPTDVPRHGTHYQHVLDIAGSVPRDFANYHLRVDAHVRGALWRTQTHPLCTSLHSNPEMEMRQCASGNGSFSAQVWSFIPSWSGSILNSGAASSQPHSALPSFATPPRPKLVADAGQHTGSARPRDVPPSSRPAAAQLRQALHVLSRINVCSLSSTADPSLRTRADGPEPLPDRLVGVACNTSIAKALNMSHNSAAAIEAAGAAGANKGIVGRVSPDLLMQSSQWIREAHSDMYPRDWRTIGVMFVLAALTLPHPFTIVERRANTEHRSYTSLSLSRLL